MEYKSLNANDLAAARRIIDQFNDDSYGRHNSNVDRRNGTPLFPNGIEPPVTNQVASPETPRIDFIGIRNVIQQCARLAQRRMLRTRVYDEGYTRQERVGFAGGPFGFPLDIPNDRFKSKPEDCDVGDYCPNDSPSDLPSGVSYEPLSLSVGDSQFESAIIWNPTRGSRNFWKRVK